MIVRAGDYVIYDGKVLKVTDAVDQGALETQENPDDLCIGEIVVPEHKAGRTMVFPSSAITGIYR